jgi:outer membrane protein assembly factor BamD
LPPSHAQRPPFRRPRAAALAAALACAAALAGCAGDNERDMKSGAEQIYEKAHAAMESGNYRNAIAYYEALEARFPFSNQAKQAQLDLIYAYYKNGERESAIDAANQFERENPTHPRVDYALYMRGLSTFQGQSNAFYRLLNVDLAKRPPERARESFSAFSQLLQRYPDSIYAPDARQRMVFLRNRLAEHENHVARYYYERGAWLAALKRAQFAMQSYDGAPAVAESLRIMVDSYRQLGMTDLAESTRAVLADSFPEDAVAQAKAEERPWYKFW